MIFPLQYRIFSNCTNLILEDGLTIHFGHRIKQEGRDRMYRKEEKPVNISTERQEAKSILEG